MRALLPAIGALLIVPPSFGQSRALPAANKDILAFVEAHLGQKVGRGECWDLAAEALNEAHARWDGFYGFGTEEPVEDVLPGDIIQFDGVQVEVRTPGSIQRERYGKHTAIVAAVHAPGVFTIAHQNAGPAGRKVNKTELAVANVTAGKLRFYRPVR